MDPENIFSAPNAEDIAEAERRLGLRFHPDYIRFMQGGYDLGDAIIEPLLIHPNAGHLDMFTAVEEARKYYGLPEHLLPIVEDNSDYYCINESGEIAFWSHNGTTDEKWANIEVWRAQMIEEAS